MRFFLDVSFRTVFVSLLVWANSLNLHAQVLEDKTEIKLKGDGTSGPFFISQHYILLYTEEVLRDSTILQREKDYSIDYNKGLLWLNQPLEKDDSISVTFEEFSPKVKKRYFHRELGFSQEAKSSYSSVFSRDGASVKNASYTFRTPISQMPQEKSFSPDLQITGNKTFSFDLGNSEAFSLSQGLNLKIAGDLTKEVKVLALLSDRGQGGTTYGTTKRLEELDKILMQVTSPNFNGFLGDQYLSYQGNLSGRYDKKLQGVSSEVKFSQNSVSMSYASSKGRYGYNSFYGVEGKQGPYYLKGENGERNIQILPGTEKVYLNGKLLERGSENDYTIDYSRGVLNFSSTRLITADSRLKAEFEYSDQNYEKSFYSTKGEINLFQGSLKLSGLFLDERDDKNSPLSTAFSSEDKDILKNSGEDKTKVFKDGAQYTGEGKGDYILLADSLGSPYYQYAGKDSGDYLVSFSWVGSLQGSYSYKGAGVYSYVYPGKGDYLPIIYLPMPSSHSLLDLNMSLNPFQGFTSELGWGLSRKDLNLFSDLGDEDNSGDALLLKTGYEKQDLNFLGHNLPGLKFEGLYRNLEENFLPFGRLDKIERERDWGFSPDSISGSEKVMRFKSFISPLENLSLGGDWGVLKKGNSFESKRRGFNALFSPLKNLEAKASSEDIKSTQKGESLVQTGNWQRRDFNLTQGWRKLKTQLGWEMEKQEFAREDSSFQDRRYDEFKGRMGLGSGGLWEFSSQLVYRQDKIKDGSWKKSSDAYTWQNLISLRNYKEVFSSNFEHTYRQKNIKSGESSKGNLGALKLDYYPKNQAVVLNLYYSVNLLGSEKRMDNYIEVGEGRGDYRYENGEYIPDPQGDFILQKEVLDEYIPGKKLDKSFKTVFKPGKLFTSVNLLNQFYTDVYLRSSDLISGKVNWSNFVFNPLSAGFSRETLLKDHSRIYDLYLFPLSPLNLRLRWTLDQSENLLLLSGTDRDNKTSRSALLRYRISFKNLLESEIIQERRERDKVYSNSLLIQGKSLKVSFTRREKKSLELTLSSKLKEEKEELSELKVSLFELSPKVTYSLLGKGKLRSEFSWYRVGISPQDQVLPWEMAEGKREGDNFTWSLGFDFKLNQTLSASFAYSGLKEPIRGTRHNGKFEIKAYF